MHVDVFSKYFRYLCKDGRKQAAAYTLIYMNCKIFLLFLIVSANVCAASADDINDLYRKLDYAIAHSDEYVKQREARISTLKKSVRNHEMMREVYDTYLNIYEEYKCYDNDSAVAYLDKAIASARKMQRKDLAADCMALQAFQCSSVGSYAEALQLLSLTRCDISGKKGLTDYYTACCHVYGELGFYSKMNEQSQSFYKKSNLYRDSLYSILPPNDETYLMKKEMDLSSARKYAEAMKINDQRLRQCRPGTHEYGIVAYYRSQLYRHLKDTVNEKRWLITSATCDVQNAVMDQASLWNLANIIANEGDVDRAYRYINFSWNAARTFGTMVRNWQISPLLGNIDHTYQAKIKQANVWLTVSTIIVSMMVLLLLFLLYYANKQKRYVTAARNELRETNTRLVELNEKMKHTNDKLDESNRVKEEYIGQFLSLCSMYIDNMDKFRMQVGRLVKGRKMDELQALVKNTTMKEQELDDLYKNFDTAFLHLFPNFVDDLNSLLRPECHITLTEKGRLTTTTRVFALIRLGVDDSTKIAEFLHYAVNTIYNYRAKLRNGAIGDRNEFEKKVKKLGLVTL